MSSFSRPTAPARKVRDTRSEKRIEYSGDRAMAMLGFSIWRFSQSRATQQSPGIPDRRYVNVVWGVAFWWEAKKEGGEQSPHQRAFELECSSVGEHYVCGTDVTLGAFAVALLEKAKHPTTHRGQGPLRSDLPMTQIAKFYGASDDLIEVEGVKGADEFSAMTHTDGGVAGVFNLGGKLRIRAIYDGCWSFSVGQVDEDIAIPDWPIRVEQHPTTPYSACLIIECPDDVKVFEEKR
jgi:hypothetical protein